MAINTETKPVGEDGSNWGREAATEGARGTPGARVVLPVAWECEIHSGGPVRVLFCMLMSQRTMKMWAPGRHPD